MIAVALKLYLLTFEFPMAVALDRVGVDKVTFQYLRFPGRSEFCLASPLFCLLL